MSAGMIGVRRVLFAVVLGAGTGLMGWSGGTAQPNPYADVPMDDRGQMDCARLLEICVGRGDGSESVREQCLERAGQCRADNQQRWEATGEALQALERERVAALAQTVPERLRGPRPHGRRGARRPEAGLDEAGAEEAAAANSGEEEEPPAVEDAPTQEEEEPQG